MNDFISIQKNRPHKVFDGDGNEIPDCIECNLEKGIIRRILCTVLDNGVVQSRVIEEIYPTPLRIEYVKCLECNGTGKYIGLNVIEDCKACCKNE